MSVAFRPVVSRLRSLAAGLAVDLPLVALAVATRIRLALPPGDDAYIVLAVVRNALAGLGPHLDPDSGDAVLSTLLWPLLLAALSVVGLAPVAALGLLSLLSEIALALVVWRLGEALSGSRAAGALAAAALITNPVLLLPALSGMETPLVLALVAAGALAVARDRPAAAAVAIALLPWSRFDAALAALVLAAFAVRTPRGLLASSRWRLAAGALAGASSFVAHRAVFGFWLPASVTAKAAAGGVGADGAVAVAREFARAMAGESAYWLVEPTVHLLLVPLAVWGAIRLVRCSELGVRAAPLVIWSALYVTAFVASGRGYAVNFPWYFAPPLLGVACLAAAGAAPALEALGRGLRKLSPTLPAAVALGVGLLAAPRVEDGIERVRASFVAHRERAYAAAALWLDRYGRPSSVASNEVGTLAWHLGPETSIVDLFGLSRRPGERGVDGVALALARRPEAIVTRIDFRWRRAIETADPDGWVWVRAGSIDLGLEPALARRLEPHAGELTRIYRGLGSAGGGAGGLR